MNNFRKSYFKIGAAFAVLAALTSAFAISCGGNVTGGGGSDNEPDVGPSTETKLQTLSVYYSETSEDDNLIQFNANAQKSVYTIESPDPTKNITVSVEPVSAEATTLISWTHGSASGSTEGPATGKVNLGLIPVPLDQNDTIISVTVTNGNEYFVFKITVKPPEFNTTLKSLSLKVVDDSEELITGFMPSLSQYVARVTNPAYAARGVVITPETTDANATFSIDPPTSTVPAIGSPARTITITVTNNNISSDYTISLVPPQNALSTDATLQFLQFAYDDDSLAISDFYTDSYEYSIQAPQGLHNVRITQLVPSSSLVTDDKVRVTQGINNASAPYAYSVENPPARATEIALPVVDAELKFVIRVTAENGDIRTYNVTFKNPSATFVWHGKVILNDSTKELFEIEVPISNGSRETSSFNAQGEWSVNINEIYSPTSFVVVLHSVGLIPQRSFRESFPVDGRTKDDNIVLTINSANLANMVFTPNDLAAMTPTENYFLMNDIDLNEFTGGGSTPINWVGQTNYSGNFNGNGHTIDLTLKKTDGDTGLFTSLANGAIVENFTLNVVTESGLRMSNNSHFGGVVGVIGSTGTFRIRNIAVSGSLNYGTQTAANLYLIVGGLIGEVQESTSAIKLEMLKCLLKIFKV
jgi:hypothetical protein